MTSLEFRGLRISIAKDTHSIYDELVSKNDRDSQDRPFATMKDVFITSACLGLKHGHYLPIESSRDIFSGDTFNPRTDIPVLAALTFYHTKTLKSLGDPKQVLEIAQGYANGGIHPLQEELKGRAGARPLQRLIDMLTE